VPYSTDCSEGVWIAALLRPPASGMPNHRPTGCRTPSDRKRPHDPQTLRYPRSEPRPTYTAPTRAAAWSGGAIVGAIIATVIVLGFILYEVTKIVTHAGDTTTSVPRTAYQGIQTRKENSWHKDPSGRLWSA
jgi:hypothetical protein